MGEEIGGARQRSVRKQEEPDRDAGEARDRDGGGDRGDRQMWEKPKETDRDETETRGDRQSRREKQKKQTGCEHVTKRKKISPKGAESRSRYSE